MRGATKTQKGQARKVCRERYHHQCAICGSIDRPTVHHIVPLSLGGEWEQYNLILLCDWGPNGCHRLVHGWGLSMDHLTSEQQREIKRLRGYAK